MTTEEIIIPNCQGCSQPIEEGAVVAFGDSLFHVKCFICAKCGECVENKTNLLLLDDGRPVCENCSYNCVQCNQVIRDEAIMTGEKAYHSKCFKCVSCKKMIEDLIFTQTAKGIYCTACNEIRKAEKRRDKNNNNNTSHPISQPQPPQKSCLQVRSEMNSPSSSSSSSNLSTPVSSRGSSPPKSMQIDSAFDLRNLNFSFFDNESSELANLSNTLGANLSIKDQEQDKLTPQYRIKRASDVLQSSLRSSSITTSSTPMEIDTTDMEKLKRELAESRSKLEQIEKSYKTLQEASQQALSEFTQLKDDFERESNIRKQQEVTIISLVKKNGGILSRKELDKAAFMRVELERTCKELVKYRDRIVASVDDATASSTVYSNYQKTVKAQIKSLNQERDSLKAQTKELEASRDEIIHEIILLNTKNAELTTMNNDLSRRALEKEEANLTIPPSNSPPLSPSQSTETTFTPAPTKRPRKQSNASSILFNVSSRRSFISNQTPTLFRLKKKGSSMFSKFGTSSSSKSIKSEAPNSSSSSILGSRSIYNNANYSSSLHSLNYQDSSSTMSRSNKKEYNDSSASLSYVGHESHSFQPTSFLRPVKCGACGDKIWGRSEYRCDGCGFSSHSRCLSRVPQQCSASTSSSLDLTASQENMSSSASSLGQLASDIETAKPAAAREKSLDSSIFGCDLSERVQVEGCSIPAVVRECIKEVEARGLDCEGIYRKSGGAAQIRAIQLAFDQGDKINLSDEDEFNDICAITSVLKQYFRELPNPLLTYELYDKFIEVSTMNHNEQKIEAFSAVLSELPKAHLDTMGLLFNHLVKVYDECDLNRMSVKNLAMVFAPTLMRHTDPSRDFLDISYKNAIIEYMLLHTDALFPIDPPSS